MPPRRHQWSGIPGENGEEERVSRSRRKRESAALQELGEKLAALAPARRELLPLTPDLRDALAEYRRLGSREVRRRHLQYIGRLMREAEADGALDGILEAWAAQDEGAARSIGTRSSA